MESSSGSSVFPGKADGKNIHWIANDPEHAARFEEMFKNGSTLFRLILRQGHTYEGLTVEELNQARNLLDRAPEIPVPCASGCGSKAVTDTKICRKCLDEVLR